MYLRDRQQRISVPLLQTRHLPEDISMAVWKIEEPDDFFLKLLPLTEEEKIHVHELKGRRRTEWLASRWLWAVLTKDLKHGPIIKDDCGKPQIHDSDWHMSISHTHNYTAVITAPLLVGIDIQTKVEKISRIAHKFLSETEFQAVMKSGKELDQMHLYWGAKESLYKAHGRRKLDFRKHILVDNFDLSLNVTSGSLKIEEEKAFDIHYQLTNEFVLVYAIEKI